AAVIRSAGQRARRHFRECESCATTNSRLCNRPRGRCLASNIPPPFPAQKQRFHSSQAPASRRSAGSPAVRKDSPAGEIKCHSPILPPCRTTISNPRRTGELQRAPLWQPGERPLLKPRPKGEHALQHSSSERLRLIDYRTSETIPNPTGSARDFSRE